LAKAILLIPSPFYTPAGPVTKPVNQERKETTALTEVERAQGAASPVGVERWVTFCASRAVVIGIGAERTLESSA
jgi:hypothetical protein